mgnify:CR=1 FL=1
MQEAVLYTYRNRFTAGQRTVALHNYTLLLKAGFSSFDSVPYWAALDINGVRVFANCFRIHGMVLLLWKDSTRASRDTADKALALCQQAGLKAFFPYDDCGANPEWAKDALVPS